MRSHSDYIRKLSKAVRYASYILVFFSNMNPLLERKLLLPTYIPGINNETTTFFWIMYILQIIELYFVIKLMLPFIQTYLSFVIFGVAQIKVLNRRLSLLGVRKAHIKSELKSCSIFHLEIVRYSINTVIYFIVTKNILINRYVQTLNKLTIIVSFLDFFVLCVILCFILFLFGTVDNFTRALLYFFSLLNSICCIFLFCLHGNLLTEEVNFVTAEIM